MWLMPLWCWWIKRSDHSSVIGAGTGEPEAIPP